MLRFVGVVVTVCLLITATKASSPELNDVNSAVKDSAGDEYTTNIHTFLDGFGKYLPDEVHQLLSHMTAKEVEVIKSIDYAVVTSEEKFLSELTKRDPKLTEKIRAVNTTIYTKINTLPPNARDYMLRSIESLKSLGDNAASQETIQTLRHIIDDYLSLSSDDKRAIVIAFPCIGEIMTSESVKTWMDESKKSFNFQ